MKVMRPWGLVEVFVIMSLQASQTGHSKSRILHDLGIYNGSSLHCANPVSTFSSSFSFLSLFETKELRRPVTAWFDEVVRLPCQLRNHAFDVQPPVDTPPFCGFVRGLSPKPAVDSWATEFIPSKFPT